MRWATIVFPQLALDIVLRRQPDPRQALVLIHGPAQQRSLLAVNEAARAQGLRSGQRLTQAAAISDDFLALAHDPADDERWMQWLAGWAYRFSAQVCLAWPQALVLEVGHSLGLMGGWPALAARMRHELDALQFRHRIAVAPTPRAACMLAWLKDGIEVADKARLQEVLARMPVRRAGLPDATGERLYRMGIRTLGQLMAMPADGLRRRFGAELTSTLAQLCGRQTQPLDFYRPPERYDMRIELPCAVDGHQPLAFPLQRMIRDLVVFLDSRSSAVPQLQLDLEHARPPATRIVLHLLSPARNPELLFELLHSRLAQQQLTQPVLALRLQARQLQAFAPTGRDLLDERPADAVPWEQLRERLRVRLGNEAIYQISPVADPRPERAWQRTLRTTRLTATLPDWPRRPGWLLPAPRPLDGPVRRILSGPERLESGWWDGEDARRDYYVVETGNGQHAWVFTPVGKSGPWMLHGWFG